MCVIINYKWSVTSRNVNVSYWLLSIFSVTSNGDFPELKYTFCQTQLSHLVMKAEYEGIRTELSDLEQTLQPSKQSDQGHHLEAGRVFTGPTPEV